MDQPASYDISAYPVDESDNDMKIRHSSVHIDIHISILMPKWSYLKINRLIYSSSDVLSSINIYGDRTLEGVYTSLEMPVV